MGDKNLIHTLGDFSKASHEGYMNTIKLPIGLVQNGCSFHGLRSEDLNQHLKDFLKLVDSLDLDGYSMAFEKIASISHIEREEHKRKGIKSPSKLFSPNKESEAEEGETATDITPEHDHNITKEAKEEVEEHGYWASLRIEPDLISQMKEAQKEDSEIWAIVEILNKQVEFRLDDDYVLCSPFSVHPGSTKMYHDLKQYFWWSGMKRDVATFVSKCLICQQVKIEHQQASGLLQQLDIPQLDIPVWKWDEISMDFVTRLPQTQRRHDAIWVVVDRLTKSAHFLPIRKDYPVSRLAEIFQQEIVRLHGTPSAIYCFSSMTDGQSERTIQTLEDMLHSCALEWTGNWDDYICLVEFAYNNSWHASIKCAPFEMLYGRKCRAPICWDQVGERVIEGPEM
nr:transposon Ty3-I Gag-Pol polyprotein [Tanacetum cinerariifolium]